MSASRPFNEITRLKAAFGYSLQGLKAAYVHPAFRTEIWVACVMIPLALLLGDSGVEYALLTGSVFLVLIIELLNTSIETAIDRISSELHPLSKFAKDAGSAAVLLSLINAGAIWLFILLG